MEHEGKKDFGKGKDWSSADFTEHFRGMKFPAKKHDLLTHAKTKGFDRDFMDWLDRLDDKKEYHSMDDLMKDYGRKAA